MSIQSVTDVTKATALPPPVVASGAGAAVPAANGASDAVPGKGKNDAPVHVNVVVPPPPPPPPPSRGFDMNVEVGEHPETKVKMYNFVDPETGDTVVQIPSHKVLDLVASIIQQLEAQGKIL